MKLGSLFDGAGTFPFAGQQFGIKPCWASEIEAFPVAVTKKRFPNMLHLGDITKVNGAEIEPVDVITFGSPCQDLSVAGKQVGLSGERSGLFMEAVRIIKEMRGKTNGKYPRYAVWENVPGAFSSNDREDFRIVLEELCKIKDNSANVPQPTGRGGNNGKWQNAGLILGTGYSIAWRVLDAQFWGVPQRRRRIFLVADFRGESAGEILFERNGLSRSFAESRKAWKGITTDTTFGSDKSRQCFDARGNGNGNIAPTVTGDHNNRVTDYTAIVVGVDTYNQDLTGDKTKSLLAGHQDADGVPCVAINLMQDPIPNEKVFPCLSTGNPVTGQANLAICMATQQGGAEIAENLCPTITAAAGMSGNNQPVICYEAELGQASRTGRHLYENLCGTLRAKAGDNLPTVIYAIDRAAFNQGENAQYNIGIDDNGIAQTLVAKGPGAICYGVPLGFRPENTKLYKEIGTTICNGTNPGHHQGVIILVDMNLVVRRVVPIECARLQGMPDWWCIDIPHSDSAEYKMWGNGMALPCAMYLMEGIALQLQKELLSSLEVIA